MEDKDKEDIPSELDKEIYGFRIYGDNLEECQKFCKILTDYGEHIGLVFKGEYGGLDQPVYLFEFFKDYNESNQILIGLSPCGRYQDWDVSRRPKIGFGDPDIILCFVENPNEVGDPILGIEFNDAVNVGNNAWQRFPRVAQAGEKGVPFIYVVPVADAEVKDGEFRSLRHPNIIFQLAQFNLMQKYQVLSVTLYSNNPWYIDALEEGKACPGISVKRYGETLSKLIVSRMLEVILESENHNKFRTAIEEIKKEGFKKATGDMLNYISEFASSDFKILENNPVLVNEKSEVIKEWWNTIHKGSSISSEYLFFDWKEADFTREKIPFKKYLSTKSKYKDEINPKLSKIAFSYKEKANEVGFVFDTKPFVQLLLDKYSFDNLTKEYLSNTEPPILFLPIAGYVLDTGGPAFSRPDKGLVRLIEEVFCTNDLFNSKIVLLYSQLIPDNWKQQVKDAVKEGNQKSSLTNNLWRELVRWADLIIADVHEEGIVL